MGDIQGAKDENKRDKEGEMNRTKIKEMEGERKRKSLCVRERERVRESEKFLEG